MTRSRRPFRSSTAAGAAVLALFLLVIPRPLSAAEGPSSEAPGTPVNPFASRTSEAPGTPGGTHDAPLAERHRTFLEEVDLLLTDREITAFLALGRDYQRDAFVERFWRERDPDPSTGVNELRRYWSQKIDQARALFGDLTGERSRQYLVHGPPPARLEIRCRRRDPQMELWFYPGGSDLTYNRYALIFYRKWGREFRSWYPSDGVDTLTETCPWSDLLIDEQDTLQQALGWIANVHWVHYMELLGRVLERPERSAEWVETFDSYSTDLPAGAAPLPAELDLAFPGRRGSRTLVRAIVLVPRTEVETVALERAPGPGSHHLSVNGEILTDDDRLFESFRYRFDFPAAGADTVDPAEATLPLVAERLLRPGEYRLILRVTDLGSEKVFRTESPLSVPEVTRVMPAAPPADAVSRLLVEAEAALAASEATGDATLRLVPPRGELLTGLVRFETIVGGEELVDRVVFALDGEPVLTKTRPPYGVELDLGELPRSRRVTATAYDAAGTVVAFDGLDANSGVNRFALRLLEPLPGRAYRESLPVRAQIEVPEGETIERLELYLEERLVATLYGEPWSQGLVLSADEEPLYLRASAYLEDGHSTEEVILLGPASRASEDGSPRFGGSVDVRMVELFVTVVDRRGRPVTGLDEGDFQVFEEGKEQTVLRFERVDDRPIHAAILLDVSASMDERLDGARQAALGFYQNVVDPIDRAALLTFNHRPQLSVPFTSELTSLATGLAALQAERGTALWDSVIYGLYSFNEISGQKALLVLSDGEDESSRFRFDEALELARRSGVTIYSIGLDLPRGDGRRQLRRLAEETGGRSFLVRSTDELPAIYRQIEEDLRAQYLLAYQSSNGSEGTGFRGVRVDLPEHDGLTVRTSTGYYP